MSPMNVIDRLLAADIHVMLGAFYVGLLGGTNTTWNIRNIDANIARLEFHMGIPMGRHIRCPSIRDCAMSVYLLLKGMGLCAPTKVITLFRGVCDNANVISQLKR